MNSDKIQVSKGLDITTNKIPMSERRGVSHHLLGEFPSEFSPSDFWVDVLTPVLNQYLVKRVDEMMKSGMYEEFEKFFEENEFSGSNSVGRHSGLRKAIGVPEMERYFEKYMNCTQVKEIKENTRQLAEKQIWKIQRLEKLGGNYKDLMPKRQSRRRPRYGINKW